MLYSLSEIRYGLVVFARVYIVVGISEVPFLACRPVNGVALHAAYHVLGIIQPSLLYIRLGEPGARLGIDGRLRLVEASHVGKSRCCLVEGTLVELRAPHEHPRLPQKRVVFAPRQPLYVLCRLAPLLGPHGPPLYAVQLDGFLAFLYSSVEIALSDFAARLVAHGVERNNLGEVVLVAVLLLKRAVDIGERAVIISIVTGLEGVPQPCLGRVFLRRASCRGNNQCRENQGDDMSCF